MNKGKEKKKKKKEHPLSFQDFERLRVANCLVGLGLSDLKSEFQKHLWELYCNSLVFYISIYLVLSDKPN